MSAFKFDNVIELSLMAETNIVARGIEVRPI